MNDFPASTETPLRGGPTLRWGVLAPGRIATDFVETLHRNSDQRMHAVASRSFERAAAFGARFGIGATTIGPFFLYIGGLSVVMRTVFLGPIVDRIGETWAMRFGAMLLIVGLLLYPLRVWCRWLAVVGRRWSGWVAGSAFEQPRRAASAGPFRY